MSFVLLLSVCFCCIKTAEPVYSQMTQHAFTGGTVQLKCYGVRQLEHAMWLLKMSNVKNEFPLSQGLIIVNKTLAQRLKVLNDNNTLILTIFSATLNDCGKYRCLYDQMRVSNEEITLIITDPPSVTVHYVNHTIYCNMSANGNTINTTVFKWEHRTIYNEHIRFFNNSNIGVLSIASDKRATELLYLYNGKYTCTTEITVRKVEKPWVQTVETLVEIQGPPVCVKDGSTRNVTFSERNVAVSFKFVSLPKYVDIVWSKDNIRRIIDQQKNNILVTEHNTSIVAFNAQVIINVYLAKLIIYNVSKDDFGNYTAKINNTVGQCECVTELNNPDYINVVGSQPDNMLSYKNIKSHGIVVFVMIMLFCLTLLCMVYIKRRCQRAELNTNVPNNNQHASEFDMQQIRNSYDSINEANMIQFSSTLQSQPEPYVSVSALEESMNDYETIEHHIISHREIIIQRRTDTDETSSDDSVTHDTNDYLNPYQTLQISMLDIHNYSDIIYPVSEEN